MSSPAPRSGDPDGAERRVDDFDYELPPELIAQTPPERRDDGRLLVLGRATGEVTHRRVRDLPALLGAGDLLVANNSRVLPARLRATKVPSGGQVEILLLRPEGSGRWLALGRPVRRLVPGQRLRLLPRSTTADVAVEPNRDAATSAVVGIELEVIEIRSGGEVLVAVPAGFVDDLPRFGAPPLPPYIRTALGDDERYQTTFASAPGSAAAPTAGLHFSTELIAELRRGGVGWAEVTLHVGVDTFRPVTATLVRQHLIHREWCSLPATTATEIWAARRRGGRVVAVGTTAARTLETYGARGRSVAREPMAVETDLFIVPGHRWTVVDALFTNFHLPRSSLLMMVAAFAGREAILAAYDEAIRERYRFYSFGDAMLIL